MNVNDPSEDWKQQETVIAVEGDSPGDWTYSTYPNWDEAMAAVEAARQAKAAVIYAGASPPTPPE
ncbi:hypothetical protein B7486_33195 [cyanobacterium TDX16]|nr:hypothetical protein B7486_33195 [cyanobacterium TDX16]